MKKLKKVIVGGKGFYGHVIKSYPHDIFVEEKKDYNFFKYSTYYIFGDVFFVYMYDKKVHYDICTHMFSSFEEADKFARDMIDKIEKSQQDYTRMAEDLYNKDAELIKERAYETYEYVFGTFVKEFPGLIFVNKTKDNKYVVYSKDPEENSIEYYIEFELEEDAIEAAKTLSYNKYMYFSYIQLDKTLAYRKLRHYGFIVEQVSNNIFISFTPGLFHLYHINKEVDIDACESFVDCSDAKWRAAEWIKQGRW